MILVENFPAFVVGSDTVEDVMATGSSNIIAAFTEEQVERLTDVSRRQLRYWARDNFFVPSIKIASEDLASLKLYSFRDLVCLKVISALRNDANIPFPELRRTKQQLSHLGEDLWAKTTLYVLGKTVVFDNPETGTRQDSKGQGVFEIPLRVVTGVMEDAVKAMRQRKGDQVGRIEQKRGVAQNQPVIAGTRIPVRSIQAFHKSGATTEQINKQYPSLTSEDIQAAIRYKDVA